MGFDLREMKMSVGKMEWERERDNDDGADA